MSRPRVSLLIAGIPAPKGSKDVYHRKNGSAYTVESSKALKPWLEQVAYCAKANRPGGKVLEPPYEVEMVFSMPEGQRPKYDWPTKDGDGDKLERGVFDGLVRGGLIVDDRHVIACTWRKAFGTPGVRIVIA